MSYSYVPRMSPCLSPLLHSRGQQPSTSASPATLCPGGKEVDSVACSATLLPYLVFILSRPEPMVDGSSSYWLTEPIVPSYKKLPGSYQTICSWKLGTMTYLHYGHQEMLQRGLLPLGIS